ncbi:hypothetical protein ACQ4PT_069644 [Festuca glaucescens]
MAASPASVGVGPRSCETAEQTREWMEAIAAFLGRHRPLLEAHVVNFFKVPYPSPLSSGTEILAPAVPPVVQFVSATGSLLVAAGVLDRLWETVDAEWMECLRGEPVERLLMLPSGPLAKFTAGIYPHGEFLPDSRVASIGTVLAQGMNTKKKHEIETLSVMVDAVARSCGAKTVVDVGSGQGYLAQALSFEYQLPVVAIDASSHHASVTNTRAERIKKHYAAKCVEKQQFTVPRTVTCHVLSSDTLAAVTLDACQDDHGQHVTKTNNCTETSPQNGKPNHSVPQLVLAGLHACGDLSVNMLRVFASCEQVQALSRENKGQAAGHGFGDELCNAVHQTDGPIVLDRGGILLLRQQGDESSV